MMFWTDHDLSAWGWVAMVAGMVFFGGLVIALVVLLVRGQNRPVDQVGRPRPTPEQLLGEQFARGEIEEEEYRRRLATLESAGQVVNRP
jgi:putative membrane protein